MKKLLGSLFAVSLAIGTLALFAPEPAAGGFEHCHLYTSGFQCDHQCGENDICCTQGYECEDS